MSKHTCGDPGALLQAALRSYAKRNIKSARTHTEYNPQQFAPSKRAKCWGVITTGKPISMYPEFPSTFFIHNLTFRQAMNMADKLINDISENGSTGVYVVAVHNSIARIPARTPKWRS